MGLFQKKPKLKILFVASEAAPFIKVGGLGEVMCSLPKALRDLGYDARVMLPKYATINTEEFSLQPEIFHIRPVPEDQDPHGLFISNILKHQDKKGEILAYFLENQEFYEQRANVYGYSDDPVRWALLARGVLEFLRESNWLPDVIVASDWQTGLIPNYLHTEYKKDSVLSKIATIFCIHNLYYQGMFDHHFVTEMDYDSGQAAIPAFNDPRLLKLNFMRRAIMYADIINTVSSTYAQEITTPEYGELLNDLLRERRSRLFGILNGIDYDSYGPDKDPYIEFKYNVKTLDRRVKNKIVLRRKFNLPDEKNGKNLPILSIVSRLTDQKGFGLLMDAGEPLLNNFNFQLIVLGSGDSFLMSFFKNLAHKYPDKVTVHLSYDETLPHFIFAGTDAILIPSKFEPCGLIQMEAMSYGAIPIARKTGGLSDSIIDYDPQTQTGTGFVFEKFDNYAFYGAIVRALETYRYSDFWRGIQERAMKSDFSWESSAKEYVKLFQQAIEFHRQASNSNI